MVQNYTIKFYTLNNVFPKMSIGTIKAEYGNINWTTVVFQDKKDKHG